MLEDQKHGVEDRIHIAFRDLMTELFGFVPDKPGEHYVDRKEYKKALQKIEEKYNIEQGDDDYISWFLLLIGRSPKFKKGVEENAGAGTFKSEK